MEDKKSLLGSKKSKARKELRDKIASELFKSEEGNTNTYTYTKCNINYYH